MDSDSQREHTYSESEISELIRRATQLQEASSEASSDASTSRLALSEIEAIAAELGLAPRHLRAAALELQARPEAPVSRNLLGAPFMVETAAVLDQSLTDDLWQEIVLALRRATGKKGNTSQLASAREWSHFVGEGDNGLNFQRMTATARPTGSDTHLEIRKQFAWVGALYPMALAVSVFIAFATLNAFENAAALGFGVATILGSLAGVRYYIRSLTARHKKKLVDFITRLRAAAVRTPDQVPALEAAQERIQLDDLEEQEEARTASRRRERS